MIPDNWLPYVTDDRTILDPPAYQRGGTVSFREHLDKPLSNALWEDMRYRLLCRQINVYRHDSSQKTIGHVLGGVFIFLDENDNVRDIKFSP